MNLSPLTAISPIDGRYQNKTADLQAIFSEYGLMRYRFYIEIVWLKALAAAPDIEEVPKLSPDSNKTLDLLFDTFSPKDAQDIKEIEKTTNHDVKAVEYFLKQKIANHEKLNAISEYIHFACTSEDINNLAYALMFKQAKDEHIIPAVQNLIDKFSELAKKESQTAMIARTHGQPATPTTMGKELANTAMRLARQLKQFKALEILGKINGAVGSFNAHMITFPEVDWPQIAQNLVQDIGLTWNPYTTQIEPHDWLIEHCHVLMRINSILIDAARDIWSYISIGYFKQKLKAEEVGSSTMPHKVNPIDFENAEGNLGMANALYGFFAQQLPTSRWQRDLVDSTVLRNLGSAVAYGSIAFQSFEKGLDKLEINHEALTQDLNSNWEVLGEAIQTVMRRYHIEKPYEKLKHLTRGKRITREDLQRFIETLDIPPEERQRLKELTPSNYLGNAVEMAEKLHDTLSKL